MIRRFFHALWNALKTPWVVALCLTLLLILAVWLAGPYVAVADVVLLESVVARLVATVVLIFLWGLFVALSSSRRRKKELADPEKAAEAEKKDISKGLLREQSDYIKDKIKAAIKTVTSSNFYGATGRSRYTLPWYLVLGSANSGKTSLLLNSGLQFPLNEQADRHLYNLRATELPETLFANQAVFIDTPGAYTESRPEAQTNSLWTLLLKRLFRVRPARPVNGVIFCVSMRELMDNDAPKREHLARTVRTRLSEVLKHLKVHVPVYLVLTKCDAVPGFAQFFAHLSRTEREQVFGCLTDKTAMESGNVRRELKERMQTLNAQIISKIHQERDITARGEMFRFPQELAGLGPRIEDFVFEAFGPSRYHRPVMFRGFFFTSALSAKDVMASTAREGEFAFQTGFQPSLGDYAKGFFILRLLQDCIIPEAKLAGADKEHIWSLRMRRYGLQIAACGLFLLCAFLLGVSFTNNYNKIDSITEQVKASSEERRKRPEPVVDAKALLPELALLENVTTVFAPDDDPAMTYGLGLYRGDTFTKATHAAYHGALNTRLMPALRANAAQKVEASFASVSDLKNALRAYIMLCQPDYLEEKFLLPWLNARWSERYHGDGVTQGDLERHMEYLIANGIAPATPDASLLDRARKALFKVPLAELAYQRLKEEALESGKPPFSFRASLGEHMSPFDGDTYSIAYLYTREGYEEYAVKRCPDIIRGLTEDSWIFGSAPMTLSAVDEERIHKDVRAMYFQDYIKSWSEAVHNLGVRSPGTLSDAANLAQQLTAGVSPVVLVLRDVRHHTTLVLEKQEPDGLEQAASDELSRKARQKVAGAVGAKTAKALTDRGRASIEEARAKAFEEAQKDAVAVRQYFLSLVSLLDAEGNANPALKAANDAMAKAGDYFSKLVTSDNTEQRIYSALLDIVDEKDDTLRLLEGATERLPSPVKNWYAPVPSGGLNRMMTLAANAINQAYSQRVLQVYNRDLRSLYPFNIHTDRDVNLDDFSAFFRTGGTLDSFHDAYLRPFLNPNGGVKSVMGRTLPLSPHALAQLQRANRVQHAFFDSGRGLGITFLMEPHALDAGLKQVDLAYGDKTVSYWHGPVQGASISWPASAGASSQASLVVTDLLSVQSRSNAKGEWALFRLLQKGSIKRQESSTCLLEIQQGGKWAQFLIQFRNRVNPFDPSVCSFTLPGSLL